MGTPTVSVEVITLPVEGPTPAKIRVRSGGTTVMRLDRGGPTSAPLGVDARVGDARHQGFEREPGKYPGAKKKPGPAGLSQCAERCRASEVAGDGGEI